MMGPEQDLLCFFKGCPLRCVWCHNPEGLKREPQLMIKEAACKHCGLCQKNVSIRIADNSAAAFMHALTG